MKWSILGKPTVPKVATTPSWVLAWGNTDYLKQEVIWRESNLTLIQTHPHASPPDFSRQDDCILIGEVWLSNRLHLLQRLGISQNRWQGTDADLIVQLWRRWGVEILPQLLGNYSFVLWHREREELWLVRDKVGANTLYYTTTGSTRWISPQLRSLAPYHSRELNPVALRDYLCCAYVPGEQTLWQQVRELRPGTCLCLPDTQPKIYWQPQESITAPQQPRSWHSQRLRTLLEEVVRANLPPGEPVGVFLSGGLDSSCVTALAAKFHNYPVHTYSIHFGAGCPNELEFSDRVAKHCRTQHHVLEISPEMMRSQLPQTMAELDDPIGDPLTVPNLLLGRLAKESTDIILNGEGGDPCFGGPKNQPMLLQQLYGLESDRVAALLDAYLTSYKKCFPDLPKLFKPEVWQTVREEPSVFSPDLHGDAAYLNRLMLLNIKFKGADHILTKVNNLTKAAGLVGRSPLFDPRIVQLSLEIPPDYKLAGVEEKAVLKEAVADLLPPVIIQRPKSGMMVPVQRWFRQEWQRQARGLLLAKNAAIASYLNRNLIRDWINYRGDVWQRYGIKLWLLVSLEIWLRVNRNYP
jgi:asparagine synthase (glutamine-hydrolysing)